MPVTKSDFGKNLQYLRIQKGWSLKDLAVKLGVSKASIDDYEKGVNYPKVDKLIRLCEIFSVTTDFLLGRTFDIIIELDGLNNSQREHILLMVDKTKEEFLKANQEK